MVAEQIDIQSLTRKEQAALYHEIQQKWCNKNDLCLFLVPIDQIELFTVKMKYGMKRYGVNDVDDLLKLKYIDLHKITQVGAQGRVLIFQFLLSMTPEMFIF